jgi:hypothetical protein
MPSLSLVVCVHRERDLFERLMHETSGLYGDLVVVHDGPGVNNSTAPPRVDAPVKEMGLDYGALAPDAPLPAFYKTPPLPARAGSIHELVMQHEGRYFEGPRCFQQEPHWPFSWWQAKHDWILRLDADEFPSKELKGWLGRFRDLPDPNDDISGYTCVWPLWNGTRAVTTRWPTDRIFLFHRRRVKFFGMVEQVPMPDTSYQPLQLVLHHQPKRKSHGYRNLLFRKQAYTWRHVIALSLLGSPTDLPCWRWESKQWPKGWLQLRQHPLLTAFRRLLKQPFIFLSIYLRHRRYDLFYTLPLSGVHHFLIGLKVFRLKVARALKFRKT